MIRNQQIGISYMIYQKPFYKKWQVFLEENAILEKTRAKKEGVALPSTIQTLEQYVDKNYYIQFSSINKLGINPLSSFNTPLGIYSYPLTSLIFDQLKNGQIAFASERKYIILFQPDANLNLLYTSKDISDEDFEIYVNRLYLEKSTKYLKINPNTQSDQFLKKIDEPSTIQKYNNSNVGRLWAITYSLSKKQNIKFKEANKNTNMRSWCFLLKSLHIDGIVDDDDLGIIHPSEPTQAVFFSKTGLNIIKSLDNTETPEKINIRKMSQIIHKLYKDNPHLKNYKRETVTEPNLEIWFLKNNKKHGPHLRWHRYNDQLIEKSNYVNGQLNGPYETWYENGQQWAKSNFVNGKRHGPYERWYKNGEQWEKSNFVNGQLDDLYKVWYENGQLEEKSNWRNWEKHGLCQRWYENGQLEQESNWHNGEKHGLYQSWYENGDLRHQAWYENGIIKSKEA